MAEKLWSKNYNLDSMMEEFTVRKDYILDRELVLSDLIGSAAQAKGLERIGIIKDKELKGLLSTLNEIAALQKRGEFNIDRSQEDCHTAIEQYLTERLGETGKRIHTGRSRNDQVQTALRIYMREAILKTESAALDFASSLLSFAKRNESVPMPGRTHMQIAMPSSVALWAMSFSEEIAEESMMLSSLYSLFDSSPLGSAASYGTTLPTDREYLAKEMGFSRVQNNVLYSNNARGKFEAIFLDHASYIALTISKLAQDLILFTLPEFGYFTLPKELTTGSSIMPQKKNPDGLELARSRTALILSLANSVKEIIKALPSGYNRDFQDTKEPMLEGFKMTLSLLRIMEKMTEGLEVHKDRLIAACTSELYATDRVMEKVLQGGNFRDSYKEIGLNLESVQLDDPESSIWKRRVTGSAGNINFSYAENLIAKLRGENDERRAYLSKVYSSLVPAITEVIND